MYFVNIGKNLAADIESSISTDQSSTQYLLNPTKEKCIIRCATQDEVVKAINNLSFYTMLPSYCISCCTYVYIL